MKTENIGALARMKSAADVIEKILVLHDGLHGEIEAMIRSLRDGNLGGALRINVRMNQEQLKIAQLLMGAAGLLQEVASIDPAFWEQTHRALHEERMEEERANFTALVEEWDAETCRKMIAEHTPECSDPHCWMLPIVEERLARHEPH